MIHLSSIDEADERLILEKLTNELNQKFGLGLDVNFSLSREGNSNMEEALNDPPEEGFILMGSSHAFRLAAALNSHGEHVRCLASPFWKLNGENLASTCKAVEKETALNSGATIIYHLFDNSMYFSSSEAGETSLLKWGGDGLYTTFPES